jgi:hypothetical protein
MNQGDAHARAQEGAIDMTESSAANTPRELMDAVLARHFAAEAAHDMAGILATLTENCEHDVVGWPTGVSHGYAELRPFYEALFADFRTTNVTPLRRYHGENLLVDEVLYSAVATGRPFGLDGRNRPVKFRLLHICEFEGDRIRRENVWLDAATIFAQLAG